jgi:hypothetical protein
MNGRSTTFDNISRQSRPNLYSSGGSPTLSLTPLSLSLALSQH